MFKLLHIHHEIIFIEDSLKFVDPRFKNEIILIGTPDENKIARLDKLNIVYQIFQNTPQHIRLITEHAKKFDGVVFYCLEEIKAKILVNLHRNVKTFTRFFGFELYNLCMDQYLSEKTLKVLPPLQDKKYSLKTVYNAVKRKLKILLNKEFAVNFDNQKKIYKKLDAIFVINSYEYDELKEIFYLPNLIELKFTNHENELHEFKVSEKKLSRIIVGNNGSEINNHLDILEIIQQANITEKIEFDLFFSYGNQRAYSDIVRSSVKGMSNINLVEDFLSKKEFEAVYESAAALVINSYRQNALGNIFTAIKLGCKIYLSKKSSTYKWLIAEGFRISEMNDLKNDLEGGTYKLPVAQQQQNIDCFINTMKKYSVNDFLNQVIDTLKKRK